MEINERPKQGAGDVAHTIVKAGLSAIPYVGGPAAEFFTALITPPIIKRRDEWIESLGQAILALKEKVASLNLEDLQKNEQFVTAVLYATNSASRTHDKEKLESLKNAILNIALKIEPDEDLQLIFLNHIDQLTRWHLRILSFFSSPEKWHEAHSKKKPDLIMGSLSQVLESAFDELRGNKSLYDQMVSDLHSRGLLAIASLQGTMTGHGLFIPRTTEIGNRFLAFIKAPN